VRDSVEEVADGGDASLGGDLGEFGADTWQGLEGNV
jgi:hypothetical protein